jgi:hypothetical protein
MKKNYRKEIENSRSLLVVMGFALLCLALSTWTLSEHDQWTVLCVCFNVYVGLKCFIEGIVG